MVYLVSVVFAVALTLLEYCVGFEPLVIGILAFLMARVCIKQSPV